MNHCDPAVSAGAALKLGDPAEAGLDLDSSSLYKSLITLH